MSDEYAIKKRNSTIELLRIICMLGIIAHHAVVHGGGLEVTDKGHVILSSMLLPLGKIGFDCFMVVSMWFLSGGHFNAIRLIRIWCEVLFYTVLTTTIAVIAGENVTFGQWIGSFLPINGISHGYASTYIAFYFLLPAFLILEKQTTLRQKKYIILILFYCQVIEPILAVLNITILELHPYTSEITLFFLMFEIISYIKESKMSINKIPKYIIILVACYMIITIANLIYRIDPDSTIAYYIIETNSSENSILYIISGISLFLIFNNMKPSYYKLINRIANCTLGVLLLHDSNVCRKAFWNKIIPKGMPFYWSLKLPETILALAVVTIIIFVLGSLIDIERLKFIEKPLINNKLVSRLSVKLNGIWNS